jgi:arsenate reductase (glutaredoxin)
MGAGFWRINVSTLIQIYHNNRCGKSRTALGLLQESGKPFEIIAYLKDIPGVNEIKSILKKLKIKPHDLVRTKEPVYLEKYKGKKLSDDQWIQVLHEDSILVERPIVINGNKAVIARPPEKIYEIL